VHKHSPGMALLYAPPVPRPALRRTLSVLACALPPVRFSTTSGGPVLFFSFHEHLPPAGTDPPSQNQVYEVWPRTSSCGQAARGRAHARRHREHVHCAPGAAPEAPAPWRITCWRKPCRSARQHADPCQDADGPDLHHRRGVVGTAKIAILNGLIRHTAKIAILNGLIRRR